MCVQVRFISALLAATFALTNWTGATCPDPAVKVGPRCYTLLPRQYDWIGAVAACAEARKGATILAFETQEEYDLLKPWLASVLSNATDLKYLWLYGSDLANAGTFEWHNPSGFGTLPMSFAKWGPNQPMKKEGYHCLDLNAEDQSYTFETYPCAGYLKFSEKDPPAKVEDFVVCEFDAP